MNDALGFVVAYPDGMFQGHPKKGPGGKNLHPKVDTFGLARLYSTERTARTSMAHKGGTVKEVEVILKEKK